MRCRPRIRRGVVFALLALALANVALAGAYGAGLRINATASMPEGIYRIRPAGPGAIARGTVVAICPSAAVIAAAAPRHYFEPGACPGNVEPLLKHIAGIPGDTIDVSARAVSVDGRPLPNSAALPRDCAGRPLAHVAAGRYTLPPGRVWLYAPVARSWDSRYFGPQPAAGIVGIATPVLIIGSGRACAS